MSEPHEDFTLSFFVNDVELTRQDFGHGLREWVAFQIAFTFATHAADKAAALELLRHVADTVIERVGEDVDLSGERGVIKSLGRRSILGALEEGPATLGGLRRATTTGLHAFVSRMVADGLVVSDRVATPSGKLVTVYSLPAKEPTLKEGPTL